MFVSALLLLSRSGNLGHDKQLSLQEPEEVDVAGLTLFYTLLLKAQPALKATRVPAVSQHISLFE